jgi:hypothetical protein
MLLFLQNQQISRPMWDSSGEFLGRCERIAILLFPKADEDAKSKSLCTGASRIYATLKKHRMRSSLFCPFEETVKDTRMKPD